MYAGKGLGSWGRVRVLVSRVWRGARYPWSLSFVGRRLLGQFLASGISLAISLKVEKGDAEDISKFSTMLFVIVFTSHIACLTAAVFPFITTRTYWCFPLVLVVSFAFRGERSENVLR